ncbi:hypothetical protein CDS94_003214 [Salmonella enterica subsp. enterica serovar Norwich]|nr:hypothetical protein [Salmonella enterica subsp. enterica serovar Norwich]EDT4674128.1 hypothetical protein [Salmonella enterica subsp. enterica serovar Norwich]EEH7402983.1 hypothetical protein [Salmonella enterica]
MVIPLICFSYATQLVAGCRVSTRAISAAPGIFPLRVLYYASPPDVGA